MFENPDPNNELYEILQIVNSKWEPFSINGFCSPPSINIEFSESQNENEFNKVILEFKNFKIEINYIEIDLSNFILGESTLTNKPNASELVYTISVSDHDQNEYQECLMIITTYDNGKIDVPSFQIKQTYEAKAQIATFTIEAVLIINEEVILLQLEITLPTI
ncbi:MAG: hypothetical protein KatS3mg085_562 [Candidatus Dojkabacteria bacterium]|nr:MAG: hypothetical protein KatS3mg085_562 [Candidatus Dojkabacteria bacterium]